MNTKAQRGISRPITIIAVVAVICIGVAAFVLTRSSDNSAPADTATSTETSSEASKKAVFAPKSTDGVAYVAKLSGTAQGSAIAATIEHDGKGNSHYLGTAPEPAEMFLLGTEYIMCDDAQCMSISTAASQPVGSKEASYSNEAIASWKNTAVHKGKQACPAGTCDAWQVTQDDHTGTLFIASDGRVSRSTWKSSELDMNIDLEYKDVTITRPENVLTIPGM